MAHFLYILFSEKQNGYYVGETPNLNVRIQQHNSHYFKKAYTKSADDWEVKLSFKCSSKANALFLEKFIKRMKSRKFIEKVISSPDILNDVLVLPLSCLSADRFVWVK